MYADACELLVFEPFSAVCQRAEKGYSFLAFFADSVYDNQKRNRFRSVPMKETTKGKWMLTVSMVLFGTIGIFRRRIPLPSGLLACLRGVIGGGFLLLLPVLRRKKPDFAAIKKNLLPLILSGAALGMNWVLLFEAYNYTTVATATLCYYVAPVLVLLAAPLLLKERLTLRKALCAFAALIGMVLVSGVLTSGFSGLKGIFFGLGAACLYATVVLINKKLSHHDSMEKTVVKLLATLPVTLLYSLCSDRGISFDGCDGAAIVRILIVGIVHTGICYALYFGSAKHLKAQTLAVFSYVDPAVAIVLSAIVLREPMDALSMVGAVLILGAELISELPKKSE